MKTAKTKLIALCLGIFLVVSGCGSSTTGNNGPVTLKIWGLFEDSDTMNTMFAAYRQKHPNVSITYTKKSVDTYESDLLNALASGTGPDIFLIHNDWLPKYQDKLKPATSASLSTQDYKNSFVKVANDDFVSGGKVYAVPLYVDSMALYYNRSLLGTNGIATPPRTWDELRKDVKKITTFNSSGFFTKSGVALGTTSNINRPEDITYLMMLQAGTQPYTSDHSHTTIDQAITDSSGNYFPGAKALTYYTSYANSLSDAYTWNSKSNYSVDAFSNGQLAFMYGYSYLKSTITAHAPNLDFDVAPVPQPDLSHDAVNFANYWGYGVSMKDNDSQAAWAWDLLKFITTKQSLQTFYTKNPWPSSRLDILNDQVKDVDLGVFATSNLTAKSFYKKDQSKVDQLTRDMIDAVTLLHKDPSTALSETAQKIDLLNSNQGGN